MIIYFQYILGATFTMRSASAPSSNMITSSSDYVWRYPPKISNVATSRPSCASTAMVTNTDYVATLGEAASYFYYLPLFSAVRKCMYLYLFIVIIFQEQ